MKSYKALFHIKDTVPTEGVTDWFNDRYGTSSHLVKLISKNNHDYIFKITDLTKLRIESTKDFVKFIEDKDMSHKLFAEIKSRCKTSGQMKAFNELVKSFASNPNQLVGKPIDDRTTIIKYLGKFTSVENAIEAVPTKLSNDSLIYRSLDKDKSKFKKASVIHLFAVEYTIDFEEGSWRKDYIILTGRDLTKLLSLTKDEKKAEELAIKFESDLFKLNNDTAINALWGLFIDLLDRPKFKNIDDKITELFSQCGQVTRYERGLRADHFDW